MGIFYNVRPPKIAKLVYNSNFTMVYGAYNELVTGANLNQLITGGPHIVYIYMVIWMILLLYMWMIYIYIYIYLHGYIYIYIHMVDIILI